MILNEPTKPIEEAQIDHVNINIHPVLLDTEIARKREGMTLRN